MYLVSIYIGEMFALTSMQTHIYAYGQIVYAIDNKIKIMKFATLLKISAYRDFVLNYVQFVICRNRIKKESNMKRTRASD